MSKLDGVKGSLVVFFRNGVVQVYYENNFFRRRLNYSAMSHCVTWHIRIFEGSKCLLLGVEAVLEK
jgi:hypothetical protein